MPPAADPPSFDRLPARSRLGPVHLVVSDLPRSVEFYHHVVGLTVLESASRDAAFAAGGSTMPLLALRQGSGVRPVARHSRLGLYHFAILLPDRLALGRFLVHLAGLRVAASTADHHVSEAVYLWDPDGLGIEVYADRPRHEWRQRGSEIYMTTEPLDIRGLVAGVEGMGWEGLPAATTIGHMHLHVGGLAAAASFYVGALGFETTVSSYPGALFMSAGGYHHHLGVNTWAGKAAASGDADARLQEWTIVVPDDQEVEKAAGRMTDAGFGIRQNGRRWRAADPWGTTVCVEAEP
jgi:catechol 2,3-dioxygenase